MAQLILYACPVGPLAKQIATYFEKSQQMCGLNAAHAYMPHCTLTGFFEDHSSAITRYTNILERVLSDYHSAIPDPPIIIKQLTFRPHWHGLELEANWLKQLVACFAKQANSPTRQTPLRLKDWLHLSLAYGFSSNCNLELQQLAGDLIDPFAAVSWELRFYQREPDNKWTCHRKYRWAP